MKKFIIEDELRGRTVYFGSFSPGRGWECWENTIEEAKVYEGTIGLFKDLKKLNKGRRPGSEVKVKEYGTE